MNRTEIQKLIESCRSEADLKLPEFASLAELVGSDPSVRRSWEQARQFDGSVRDAMHDVSHIPVPQGLEDRLLARLLGQPSDSPNEARFATADSITTDEPTEDKVGETVVGLAPDHSVPRRWSGLRWLVPLAGIAATVLIGLAVWQGQGPSLQTEDDVKSLAAEWTRQVDEAAWEKVPLPAEFEFPRELAVGHAQWQVIERRGGSATVICCDLATGGSKARLFIARTSDSTSLPSQPLAAVNHTQGQDWAYAVWSSKSSQSDTMVYVLAVSGGNSQYKSLLRGASNLASVWGRVTERRLTLGGHDPAGPNDIEGSRNLARISPPLPRPIALSDPLFESISSRWVWGEGVGG